MSGNKGNMNSSIGKYLDYLRDLLGGRERNALERNLERDPFEKDAMEGFQSISPENLETDIKQIKSQLSRRVNRSNRVLIYRIAAGIAVILTLSISYLVVFDKQINEFPENLQVSEHVENENKAVDKSIEVSDQVSNQMETGYTENDLSESEILPNEKESKLEKRITMVSDEEEADFGIVSLDEVDVDDENLSEFTIIIAEEDMAAVNVETMYDYAFQPNVEEGISAKAVEDSKPVTEFYDTNYAIQKSASRAKKAGEAPAVSWEDTAMTANEVRSLVQSYSDSDYVLEEVVIMERGEGKKTFDYIPAVPETGMKEYRKYIEKNIRFPEGFPETKRAVVIINFIILKSGKAEYFHIIESQDTAFSAEAIRLIEEGPLWIPSTRSNVYCAEETRLRIVFKK